MVFVYKKIRKVHLESFCSVKLLHSTENLVIFLLIIKHISIKVALWFKFLEDSLIEVPLF